MAQFSFPITEPSQVGQARRMANRMAQEAGVDEVGCGRVSIIATELATNLLAHAGKGELLLQAVETGHQRGIEVISIDRGPGITDLTRCMKDGYSTRGTPGNGLGAVRRQASQFDIWSGAGGTVVLARVLLPAGPEAAGKVGPLHEAIGAVSLPMEGENHCGDGWALASTEQLLRLMVVDGLGHGLGAEEAAQKAIGAFAAAPDTFGPMQLMQAADVRMKGSRGGAVAVACIDRSPGGLDYASVGNIAGTLLTHESSRGLMAHHGIVGLQFRRPSELRYPWTGSPLLILHTDGLQSRWTLTGAAYSDLLHRHPALVAAVLYRDFSRGRDDITVVVVALGLLNHG